jgi:hypothetical protein
MARLAFGARRLAGVGMIPHDSAVHRLVAAILGEACANSVPAGLEFDPALRGIDDISHNKAPMALNVILLVQLLERVPTAAHYICEAFAQGRRIRFDGGNATGIFAVTEAR